MAQFQVSIQRLTTGERRITLQNLKKAIPGRVWWFESVQAENIAKALSEAAAFLRTDDCPSWDIED